MELTTFNSHCNVFHSKEIKLVLSERLVFCFLKCNVFYYFFDFFIFIFKKYLI